MVHGGVDDHVANMAGAQILRLGRETQKRIDLALHKELERSAGRVGDPVNVLGWVEPDRGCQESRKSYPGRSCALRAQALSFQVRDAADAFIPKEFVTAHHYA